MPLGFWNDRGGERYHAAYFAKYPNVWTHGDWCELTERGTMLVYGRSDATLNPGGVRIGTAEIYSVVERIDEVEESVAIGQLWPPDNPTDTRIVLFVKLRPGYERSRTRWRSASATRSGAMRARATCRRASCRSPTSRAPRTARWSSSPSRPRCTACRSRTPRRSPTPRRSSSSGISPSFRR